MKASSQFSAKTQEIIDALTRIPKYEHRCDKTVIAQCFSEHFAALGMTPLPIRWVADANEGYLYVTKLARSAAESAARSAAESIARSAARSAAESAAWFNCSASSEVSGYAGIWLPFLKAREAGLWLYWVTEKEVVCCASPSLHVKDDRLHREDGPAVEWPAPSINRFYYLKGVQVTEDIVFKRFNWKDIDAQNNAEVRRIMLELYGQERYITESMLVPIHEDEWGTLYRKELSGDEPLMVVKVVNCTPEPDGSFKDYFLRVDPKVYGGIKTARAAVASTWRHKDGQLAFKKFEDYCPAFES